MSPALPWPMLLAALIAGLVGSGHCLVMCGGIAGALGLNSRAAAARAGRGARMPLSYNAGRVTSYAIAGALAGTAGAALTGFGTLAVVRLPLQIAAGLTLVLLGWRLAANGRGLAFLERAGMALWRWLSPLLRPLLPIDSAPRAYAAGMIWGWLPCGMAYGMLAAAWLTADPLAGFALMLAFGLGTLPALLTAAGLAQWLAGRLVSPRWRHAGGGAIVLLGLLVAAAPWLAPRLSAHPLLAACLTPY